MPKGGLISKIAFWFEDASLWARTIPGLTPISIAVNLMAQIAHEPRLGRELISPLWIASFWQRHTLGQTFERWFRCRVKANA
jgi:hypothetical protein